MRTGSVLSPRVFALISGSACFIWAFLAWLSVKPNQDILADAIQVQSLLVDPRIVLSFPGQKHAGPVEYPFQLLAELVFPGNFYAHTFPRVVFAFLTGFFTAKLFMALFPNARQWAFLTSVAIGPAIIHGLSGPEGNSVGVWWLVGNYSTSWLLVVIGAFLLIKAVAKESTWLTLSAGIIVGLGFFAHPNIIILIFPLGALTLLVVRPRLIQLVLVTFGFAIGVIPALISYFFFTGNNTWDPSRVPFFVVDFYLNALGLNGIPEYISVVLPYGFGLPTSQFLLSGSIQSFITWVLVIGIIAISLIGWIQAAIRKHWPSPIVLISTAWVSAIFGIVLFVTFVDTVWFYATSLSIMLWLTIGSLPTEVKPRSVALLLTCVLLLLEGVSTISHNWKYLSGISENVANKATYQKELQETSATLHGEGVEVLFGSYLDVIPIAYGSSYALRPISVRYNRFPLTETEADLSYLTAFKLSPGDSWSIEAQQIVNSECDFQRSVTSVTGDFQLYLCPGGAISKPR